MSTTFEDEVKQNCCGTEGKLDFEKMKQFMEECGKSNFASEELEKMKEFCRGEGAPDCTKIVSFMKECGCTCS